MTMKYHVGDIVKLKNDLHDLHDDLSVGSIGKIAYITTYRGENADIDMIIKWDNTSVNCEDWCFDFYDFDVIGREPYPSFNVGDIIELVSNTVLGDYTDYCELSNIIGDVPYDVIDERIEGVIKYIHHEDEIENNHNTGLYFNMVVDWDDRELTLDFYNPYMIKIVKSANGTNNISTTTSNTKKVDIMNITRGLIRGY